MNRNLTGMLAALIMSAVAGTAYGQSSGNNWVPNQNDATSWSGGTDWTGGFDRAKQSTATDWTGGFDSAKQSTATDWTGGFDNANRQKSCSQGRGILEKAKSYWNQVDPAYRRQYGSQFNAGLQSFQQWCNGLRQPRTVSTLGRSQPYDASTGSSLEPWKNEVSPLQRHLDISEAEKADLERMIAHWKNLPAARQAKLREIAKLTDEELYQIINNANPIDGRNPLAIALTIAQNLDAWMKTQFTHATDQERQKMCRIWFPMGINKPSSCR
jgi:hypothetical protein